MTNIDHLRNIVSLRPPKDESAMHFVLDSWKRGVKAMPVYEWMDHESFAHVAAAINRIAENAPILVASYDQTPDTYAGWICFGKGVLYYTYVKSALRRMGLATLMYEAAYFFPSSSGWWTPFWSHVLFDLSNFNLRYNPKLLTEVVR